MIDLKKLWDSMPRDVQKKISLHDLKRTVDNYNSVEEEFPNHKRYYPCKECGIVGNLTENTICPICGGE